MTLKVYAVVRTTSRKVRNEGRPPQIEYYRLQVWKEACWGTELDAYCFTKKKEWAEKTADFYRKDGAKVIEAEIVMPDLTPA